MKKIALVLAGSGVYDGSEIHEATITMLAIAKSGNSYQCFAPDIKQHHVINHITGEVMDETRDVLVESARVARGDVKPLDSFNAKEFDAIVVPGGFGAAKNLSDFAFNGAECTINRDLEVALITSANEAIPIGAICITPAIITKVLPGAAVTIGSNRETIAAITAMGGEHHETENGELIIDEKYRLVTTPGYMLDADISQVAEGIEGLISAVIELTDMPVEELAE